MSYNDNLYDLYSQIVKIFGAMWNMKIGQIYWIWNTFHSVFCFSILHLALLYGVWVAEWGLAGQAVRMVHLC